MEYFLSSEGLQEISWLLVLGVLLVLLVGVFFEYCRKYDDRFFIAQQPEDELQEANSSYPDYWRDEALNRRLKTIHDIAEERLKRQNK